MMGTRRTYYILLYSPGLESQEASLPSQFNVSTGQVA